jgi:hypothetical protein
MKDALQYTIKFAQDNPQISPVLDHISNTIQK